MLNMYVNKIDFSAYFSLLWDKKNYAIFNFCVEFSSYYDKTNC